MNALPGIAAEEHAPAFGDPLYVIDVACDSGGEFASDRGALYVEAPGTIRVGLDRSGRLPAVDAAAFDLLLTTAESSARPWIGIPAAQFDAAIDALRAATRRRPLAASVLAQVLRDGEKLSFGAALSLESLAYSTLLGGSEFRAWRTARPPRAARVDDPLRVRSHCSDNLLSIELARAARRNAFDARMRDELVEALAVAVADASLCVELRGDGPDFSAGGDLEEFGSATDLALAHAIRTLRSPAAQLHRVRERATAFLHGACIGAGIEVPAAAARVVADVDAWFQLPEIAMGLIPGAGGTVTLPRRIGRHRMLYWALSGQRMDVRRALDWGLVDGLQERA
jgi:hypothetical protein